MAPPSGTPAEVAELWKLKFPLLALPLALETVPNPDTSRNVGVLEGSFEEAVRSNVKDPAVQNGEIPGATVLNIHGLVKTVGLVR